MRSIGEYNSIIDVTGISVGNYADEHILSGVTVVMAKGGAVGAVDVRGSAPGTRETDLLHPLNLIERVDAVCLCGGSAFGLAAASGVSRFLEERGVGHPVGEGRFVPIVPAAVIFDLGRGPTKGHIGEEAGYLACEAAGPRVFRMGNFGAGTGAVSGGYKGGLGTASEVLESGTTVGALAVVNSTGHTFDPETGGLYARHLELCDEFGNLRRDTPIGAPKYPHLRSEEGKQTTIGIVVTNAKLTKAQATKVAQMAQDGLARAIYPAHTMFDGDTIFCLATGEVPLRADETRYGRGMGRAVSLIGASAADAFARSIVRALLAAKTVGKYRAYEDVFPTNFTQR